MSPTLAPAMRGVHAALAGRYYPVIVWGEEALRGLGARLPAGLDHEIMLVLENRDMADAGQRLQDGGFQRAPWSFGIDVEHRSPMSHKANDQIMKDFSSFDMWSERYVYRPNGIISDAEGTIKVALIPATYAKISTEQASPDDFEEDRGLYWPSPRRLMISFVETLVDGPIAGSWKYLLQMWAAFWLYQGTKLPETVMDDCGNGMAKRYFDACIRPLQFAPLPNLSGMQCQWVGVYTPPYFF